MSPYRGYILMPSFNYSKLGYNSLKWTVEIFVQPSERRAQTISLETIVGNISDFQRTIQLNLPELLGKSKITVFIYLGS